MSERFQLEMSAISITSARWRWRKSTEMHVEKVGVYSYQTFFNFLHQTDVTGVDVSEFVNMNILSTLRTHFGKVWAFNGISLK